jgi:hypothetical protein
MNFFITKEQFRRIYPFLLYLISFTVLLYWVLSKYGYDDPYVTYRYASQLAHGQGFVYNPGDRVLSTTTPLFTMLLALGSFIWPDIPHLANLIGCFSLACGGLSLWLASQAWKQPIVGWVGLWLYPTFLLLLQTMGSETPLYLAFCLGAIASYAYRHYHLTALLAALAVLTRGDGILLAAVLGVHYLLTARGRIPWTALGLFIGILAPWFIFSWAYFGSPLPATLAAKRAQGSMAISQRFAAGIVTIAKPYLNSWGYRVEIFLAVTGLAYLVWRARSFALIITWTILYFVAYSVLGVSRYFWYYAPLVPGFVALFGLGIVALTKFVNKLFVRMAKSITYGEAGRRIRVLAVLLLLPFVIIQASNAWQLQNRVDARIKIYQAIGDWLRASTPASAMVGTLEVGIIGYYAQRPVVDFAGLIQPEVAAHLTRDATYEDAALWAVSRYDPQFLVLHDGIFPRLEKGYAADHCQAVKHFNGKDYNFPQNMTVYECR